jgi:hypothetical protein
MKIWNVNYVPGFHDLSISLAEGIPEKSGT